MKLNIKLNLKTYCRNWEPSPLGGDTGPDDEFECFVLKYFFALDKNGLAFYQGPVLPPRTDGSTFKHGLNEVASGKV